MPISNLSNGLRTGVCTSTNRPTTPYEGQMIYETDTDVVAVWNGTAWRNIAATTATSGSVLQVIYGSTTTNTTESLAVFVDTTLTATITPQSTTSKILVMVCQNGLLKNNGNANNGLNLRLMRGATNIATFLTAGGYTSTATDNIFGGVAVNVLDEPATISATTYKTQMQNQAVAANVQTQFANDRSTIVLMEISA